MSFFYEQSHSVSSFLRGVQPKGNEYPCSVTQWHPDSGVSNFATQRTDEIQSLKDAPLTIIDAPIDDLNPECLAGLLSLVERFRIPGSFLDESDRHVINSFGYQEEDDQTVKSTWLRFLVKEIDQEEVVFSNPPTQGSNSLSDILRAILPSFLAPPIQNQAQSPVTSGLRIPLVMPGNEASTHSSNWTRCAFFIRMEKPSVPAGPLHKVVVIGFQTPPSILDELQSLDSRTSISHVLEHPFILWEIITYHLSVCLEEEVFRLTQCFATEQKSLGYLTSKPMTPLGDMDFSSLHLLADHIVLLLEGAKGLSASMNGLISGHRSICSRQRQTFLMRKTSHALEYRQGFVQATLERAMTFDKRIDNMINLFFNHMSLQDSGFMIRDSSSLRNLSTLTLIFLPITTVATICGSEFFYTSEPSDGGRGAVQMMGSAWIMFLLSALITLGLIGAWRWNANRNDKAFSRGAGRPMKLAKTLQAV